MEPSTMSAHLHRSLSEPLQLCEATRRDLTTILAQITPEKWAAGIDNGAWTIAEHVDHLIRSEVGTSKMARRLIRGDFQSVTKPSEARVYDSHLDRYPYGPLQAPAGLAPVALLMNEAAEQLAVVHRRFVEELLRFEGPDADALASVDPATGVWFTLGGWVRLQALHEAHHIDQIEALLTRA